MKKIVLGIVSVVACPCHILILLVLLSGTGVGGALAAHRGWLLVGMSLLFVAALTALTGGGALLPRRARSCPVPNAKPVAQTTPPIDGVAADLKEQHAGEVLHERVAAHRS